MESVVNLRIVRSFTMYQSRGWAGLEIMTQRKIAAVLLDITGVLYESGSDGGHVIEGSQK